MKKIALALAAAATMALAAGPSTAGERLSRDAKLAKLLEGRVAGEPRSCINTRVNQNSEVIDGTAVVYGRGRTIWVNVPENAQDLDDNDALLIRQFGPQLCRQDIVTTFNPFGGFYTGNVFLGDFVPYTRVD
ncbi:MULTISPECIES: hypothetical protein [Bacteria]|uniref:hypothetical protein n=1 Tax=Bacteria TaxID=2 RepID=UPI00103B5304|nr:MULTISPECIES: hypothetical protein [Bacteria]QDM40865.1 hypothetical protein C0V74_07365 [Altererythrobacter sp. TH136]TCJ39847.1 hypothetical protein E0504_07950 [Parafrankia sp. BMG5.11]